MSSHIEPRSVDSYLSGICSELEQFFPDVRRIRSSSLVSRCLKGCKRLCSKPIRRKAPLTKTHLRTIAATISDAYDDLLFFAQLLTGFHGLLRLGELVWPDKPALRQFRKLALRPFAQLHSDHFSFLLPSHKADAFFEGNRVLIQTVTDSPDPLRAFHAYLAMRDSAFLLRPELWLRHDGTVPTRSWFLTRLRTLLPSDANIAGHSLRAGGATSLAEAGVLPLTIQALGRWSSDTWQIYIRKHPVLLNALLFGGRALFDSPATAHPT